MVQGESGLSWHRIEQVQLGDRVALGGRVYGKMVIEGKRKELFTYKGVVLSGGQAVLENDTWYRAADSVAALPLSDDDFWLRISSEEHFMKLFCLDVDFHAFVIQLGSSAGRQSETAVFADFSEIDAHDYLARKFDDDLIETLQSFERVLVV
eukprot:TRINITY_DN77556_c0_g1_i1.p1 TRINITY_DN77556_c0_g1~~TRINITY_DN77556_c0_g1_i1.p1  ORF type:complete len:169 (+),score=32.46 TRINITY_DN77556_c0_g1_i1:54-509(+)